MRRQAVHASRELWLILSLVPLNDKTLCYPSLLLHPVVVSEVPRLLVAISIFAKERVEGVA